MVEADKEQLTLLSFNQLFRGRQKERIRRIPHDQLVSPLDSKKQETPGKYQMWVWLQMEWCFHKFSWWGGLILHHMGCWVGRYAREVSLATIAEFWILMLILFGRNDRKVRRQKMLIEYKSTEEDKQKSEMIKYKLLLYRFIKSRKIKSIYRFVIFFSFLYQFEEKKDGGSG